LQNKHCQPCRDMADRNKDEISHKGKKIQKYNLAFKKEIVAYAELNGNRPASRRYLVDTKRIREWRSQKINIESMLATKNGKQRSRLSGGGRKPLSTKLEEVLLEWIENRRSRGLRVSCKLIMKKAAMTYSGMKESGADDDNFKASRGWLRRFMKRNGLSLRRKTSVAQQDPERMVAKLVSYVIQVRRWKQSTTTMQPT